jgi:hypothetical protein
MAKLKSTEEKLKTALEESKAINAELSKQIETLQKETEDLKKGAKKTEGGQTRTNNITTSGQTVETPNPFRPPTTNNGSGLFPPTYGGSDLAAFNFGHTPSGWVKSGNGGSTFALAGPISTCPGAF